MCLKLPKKDWLIGAINITKYPAVMWREFFRWIYFSKYVINILIYTLFVQTVYLPMISSKDAAFSCHERRFFHKVEGPVIKIFDLIGCEHDLDLIHPFSTVLIGFPTLKKEAKIAMLYYSAAVNGPLSCVCSSQPRPSVRSTPRSVFLYLTSEMFLGQ